jgi:hypothetical protein
MSCAATFPTQLETGRIQPSKSPMASPFFFVKKKDRTLRPVQDYRKLNEMTIKNRYPLPLISELIDKLSEAKYFSKMDVRWGYMESGVSNQLRIIRTIGNVLRTYQFASNIPNHDE